MVPEDEDSNGNKSGSSSSSSSSSSNVTGGDGNVALAVADVQKVEVAARNERELAEQERRKGEAFEREIEQKWAEFITESDHVETYGAEEAITRSL